MIRKGFSRTKAQIRRHADGDEEQAQQQALEGLDIRLQFVAKFAIRQQYAGKKRTERQGQPDLAHQQCGSQHDQTVPRR